MTVNPLPFALCLLPFAFCHIDKYYLELTLFIITYY